MTITWPEQQENSSSTAQLALAIPLPPGHQEDQEELHHIQQLEDVELGGDETEVVAHVETLNKECKASETGTRAKEVEGVKEFHSTVKPSPSVVSSRRTRLCAWIVLQVVVAVSVALIVKNKDKFTQKFRGTTPTKTPVSSPTVDFPGTEEPSSSIKFLPYANLHSVWKPVHDWRVEEVDGVYQLVDYLNDGRTVLTRTQGTTTNLNSFESLQPTNKTRAFLGERPHLQTIDSYMILQPGIEIRGDEEWTISFAGAAVRIDSNSFDIILGPSGQCNCQLRYESNNEIGFVTDNDGYGWYEQGISLAKSNYKFHILTLTNDRSGTTRMYQDSQLVWEKTTTEGWAKFAYVGAWFNGQYSAQIIVSRIAFMKTAVADIDTLVDMMKRMEYYK